MNKTALIVATIVVVATATMHFTFKYYYEQLYERFPELDQARVRKTFRKLLAESLNGNMRGRITDYDSVDREFLLIYDSL